MRFRWIIDNEASPSRALATGALLARGELEEGVDAVLYGAPISGQSVVLGRWQRSSDALRAEAAREQGLELLRRSTGGPMAMATEGILYVALGLRHASVLVDTPPDRLLNRNVRGLLSGLCRGDAGAHYFGRHWLSVARRPAGLLGWAREPGGRVLLELFLSLERSAVCDQSLVAYPTASEAPWLGKEPVTLAEAWGKTIGPEQVMGWLAEGHRERYGESLELERSSLTDSERTRADAEAESHGVRDEQDADGLAWSPPHEIPIGWLSAGVRLGDGLVEAARVAGDFYQDTDAPRVLEEQLVGKAPEPATVLAAVSATWDGSARAMEGVKGLEPVAQCILEAAQI